MNSFIFENRKYYFVEDVRIENIQLYVGLKGAA